MVHTPTDLHSLLLDHAQTRRGLTGIQHPCLRTLQCLHILASLGSDTTHALHHVQHQTLGLQQRLNLALDHKGDVALLHFGSILDECGHLQFRIECMENAFCHGHTCQHAIFLHDQLALAHLRSGDATERCMVAVANVFREGQPNQLSNQLLFCLL